MSNAQECRPLYRFRARTLALLSLFSVSAVFLIAALFQMQILNHGDYLSRAKNQITVGATIKAPRGLILAAGGEVLADNKTVWRVWLSPTDVRAKTKETGTDYAQLIASSLSELLGLDRDTVFRKATHFTTLDQTVLKGCDEQTARAVLRLASEHGLSSMIHVEAGYARYYPFRNLASHALGFTGSDLQGLYGLEAYYDGTLRGTDGKYQKAIDSTGKELPDEYATYIKAEEGNTIHTTLDVTIQRELELQLEAALENAGAANRACGIVMNVHTGAILGMATYPAYDCNDPYTLDALSEAAVALSVSQGAVSSECKAEALYRMWNNKTVSETYEPGSTFKIVTAAIAFEEKAITESTRFSCPGYHTVGGWRISCHKKTGHGAGITFATGLQQSCNPVMMQTAERIGSAAFYRYVEALGYLKKTGVDLPSEARGIFHTANAFGTTELATASFGQRFKTTPLQQLCAIATVANGGTEITPHLVNKITDKDGNTVWQREIKTGNRILSPETCRTVATILEGGVSGNGGAKNAYARGFRIAAKTGTSEKFDVLDENGRSYLRIGSCVAFAPFDDPEIAAIIIVDEPTGASVYGSIVAAPYISALMERILPYLGHEPHYTEEELASFYECRAFCGLTVSDAVKQAKADGIAFEIVGNGDRILSQVPSAGTVIERSRGKMLLYTAPPPPDSSATVPNVLGLSLEEANALLTTGGFNIVFEGVGAFTPATEAKIVAQMPPPQTALGRGEVVKLTVRWFDSTE